MDVKDRIAKLLALAGNNPSQEEAKAALLRARELMARYKLRPEECESVDTKSVVKSEVGVQFTTRKNAWANELATIIASHYCCVAYRHHSRNSQTYDVGFIGMEDDFEICSRIYRYAFNCVEQTCDEIFNQDKDWYSAAQRRKNAEVYGWAFCSGIKRAFLAQQEEHQEWGLVMVVPQSVTDVTRNMKKSPYGKTQRNRAMRGGTDEAKRRGYEDGLAFDPASKLAQAKAPIALNA